MKLHKIIKKTIQLNIIKSTELERGIVDAIPLIQFISTYFLIKKIFK